MLNGRFKDDLKVGKILGCFGKERMELKVKMG
jgi:hypothetical protein